MLRERLQIATPDTDHTAQRKIVGFSVAVYLGNLYKNFDFEAVESWYNVFDYCTEENRLEIMMLAIEKKALEDFQDMMSTLESDLSYGFEIVKNNKDHQICKK